VGWSDHFLAEMITVGNWKRRYRGIVLYIINQNCNFKLLALIKQIHPLQKLCLNRRLMNLRAKRAYQKVPRGPTSTYT
jgi:hypothetical protein